MNAQIHRPQWLENRKKGIGGSDVAAILGLSKYKTPYQLWLEKTGRETGDTAGEPAYWGTVLEGVVAQEFAQRNKLKIQRVNQQMCGAEPWELANIDRAIINRAIAGNVRFKDGKLTTDQILECKTASGWLEKLWGDDDEAIPDYYLTQVQWYLHVTGVEIGHLAVLIGGQKYKQYRINRDDELIAILRDTVADFWQNNVQADMPPDPATLDDALHKWGQSDDSTVDADAAMLELATEYKELTSIEKEAGERKDAIKLQILQAIGTADTVLDGGKKLLTFKTQNRASFDSKAFKAAHPELAEQFTKTSATRVLRVA